MDKVDVFFGFGCELFVFYEYELFIIVGCEGGVDDIEVVVIVEFCGCECFEIFCGD